MQDNSEWDNLAEILLPEDFYRAEHRLIYQTMRQRSAANSPIDALTLIAALDSEGELATAGGSDYLIELAGNAGGTANIRAYADIICERAIRRRLISVANGIADSAYNPDGRTAEEIVNEAEQQVFKIADERPRDREPMPINPLLDGAIDRLAELAETEGSLTGLASGYRDLDQWTSGWQKSDLVIVAGRPAMGKTAFAMNLAEHAILHGDNPVLVFSLEMSAEQLIIRFLSSVGRIDQSRLRNGKLTAEDWSRFEQAVGMLRDRPLFIDDSLGLSPVEMRARARRIIREYGAIAMIVVDYLQLMRIKGTTENRVNEVSEISRSLKQLAREFRCPVVALSQLNRAVEQRTDKRPAMSDLKESGAIEQDADLVIFIYRDEVYNDGSPYKGTAEIIIGKHRNGPIAKARLCFLDYCTRFENLAESDYARFENLAWPKNHDEPYVPKG